MSNRPAHSNTHTDAFLIDVHILLLDSLLQYRPAHTRAMVMRVLGETTWFWHQSKPDCVSDC
jgi:hypothetical protein